jgi:murein DD-endopeptidase MepM/ murein hydrolase activator NlpD
VGRSAAIAIALSLIAPAAALAGGGTPAPAADAGSTDGGAGYHLVSVPKAKHRAERRRVRRARRGRVRRRARIKRRRQAPASAYRFPVAGPFDLGGADARIGAPRRGHRHQGQDITAAGGVPVVAPHAGVVEVVRYQARGAGHYVVLDSDRDYVFMHLRPGSIPVSEGQRVRAGQRLGEVGSSGSATGPHLHFEVWAGGWLTGHPVDPLPLLRRWAST